MHGSSCPGMLLVPAKNQKLHNTSHVVGGVTLKCVASNIRRLNLAWEEYQLITGLGKEGNLVVVEVISDTGFRTTVENQQGYDQPMRKGDRFMAVLANRHSGTSESGYIPRTGIEINKQTELDLLAAGGIVGINSGMPANAKKPLRLRCLGLVANQQGPVSLISLYGRQKMTMQPSAPIIIVCGTSAEIGKTTSAGNLIRALVSQGLHVAGTKFSGTGRMRDIMSLQAAGAKPVLDFPEVGMATTYTSAEIFTQGMYALFNTLNASKPDVIVAEAGGDLIEANIPTFLADKKLMQYVRAVVLVAGDVMGMMGAITYLDQHARKIPIYLTDPKGRNKTTTRERVAHELPTFKIFDSFDSAEVLTVAKEMMRK